MNDASDSPPHPPEAPTASRPAECILIVDDQPANIQTVGVLLTSMGYDIMAATSAAQALQRMMARVPDLILLDMMMPDVSGLDLCRRLQSKGAWSGIPVIFLSAAGEVNMITAALEAGAVDYVTKPFHRAELLSRVRTHLALKAARDELRRTLEDKDELLRLMAHDLKNRLAVLQIHGDFLKGESSLSPQAAQCAATISREARGMSECIREMLANQSAGRQPLHCEPLDPAEVLTDVSEVIAPLLAAKNQSLLTTLPRTPLFCMADKSALRQIMENLLSNASKFSPLQATIRLQSRSADRFVDISVADDGPGFTEEDQARVFQRYGRLSAQPTAGESSTGLGLNIVRSLVQMMGGNVTLKSEAGAGAEFTVRLPAAPWK